MRPAGGLARARPNKSSSPPAEALNPFPGALVTKPIADGRLPSAGCVRCESSSRLVTWNAGKSGGGQEFSEKDIKLAFQQFDVDNNGFLGASDISHIFMAIGEDLDDDMIDELIREADKDGDGQIAFAEFHRLVKELEKESLGGAAVEPMKDFSRKPKTMKLSSSDGSGDGSDSAGVAGGGYSHVPSFFPVLALQELLFQAKCGKHGLVVGFEPSIASQ